MDVKLIKPNGFCHGVVTAIKKSVAAANLEGNVYVLGMIIHNEIVVNELEKLGIKTIDDKTKTRLQLLDDIEEGTVIFTAHGVSDEVYMKALSKGLKVIDATCRDVKKTHNIIKEYVENDYDVIYIGKNNHPETEGCITFNTERIHLITKIEEVDQLNIDNERIIITNQTTLSILDINDIINKIINKYPKSEFINEICNATQTRQQAIIDSTDVDLIVIVGDPRSNNTQKLVEIGNNKTKVKTIRIASLNDLDIEDLKISKKVAVSAGASTPAKTIKQVVSFIEEFDKDNQATWIKDELADDILKDYM